MATKAHIHACPTEILGPILGELPPTDLATLCHVSSRLRQVAEAILYTKIEWKWQVRREIGSGLPNAELPGPQPIEALVRTLLRRPDLGDHVRVF
ncbi:hypothetical protein B0T22DRAFT_472841 [Podospora appendiculata]|uniref:F-box domain-containing protein n=1 Tax=Podospora appendiculata TaxID=314037 RepID=A0AAE0X071_9PEZI|nr:hypothetical protein B0T22DRAFT_472841 [Podospora appendiculata]